MQTEKHPSTQP